MKVKTLAEPKRSLCKWGSPESGREENRLIFLATFIAVLVLGYAPDFNGLVSWLGTFRTWRSSASYAEAPEMPAGGAGRYAHSIGDLQADSRV